MTAVETLKQYFGYDTFRDGQETLIGDILAGKDVVGIMPTGAGKSMCFQVPALMADGMTLIISPLISLMKDQVNALTQAGVAAAFINSSLNERQIQKALRNAANGAYKLIYVAPERLLTYDFMSFVRSAQMPISMLTVDEAHCISQWGQDFRPSYSKIPEFIGQLRERPIVSAFTATATPIVRDDIIKQLALDNPTVLVSGFDRQNLYFEVARAKPKDKFPILTNFLKNKQDKKDRVGIVYCSTRAAVEEVCERLNASGYNASRYHAGLSDAERRGNQEDFIYDRVQIMVATNAFGMGIDKSNVSYVVHYNMPKDMESYYQEAGRAGRDGEPADCILLYSAQDVRTNTWLIENSRDVQYADAETEHRLKERDKERLRRMTFYCATSDCLRGYILKYFGERPPNRCGNCATCNTQLVKTYQPSQPSQEIQEFQENIPISRRQTPTVPVNKDLYAVLVDLRTTIAKAHDVPSYVIFNNSTLTDMCMKLPKTPEEFLSVSGIGRVKAEQYGGRFLKAIAEFLDSNHINVNDAEGTQPSPLKEFDASEIEISEEAVSVNAIAERINCVLIESGRGKITGQKINDWLVSEGYLQVININNGNKSYKIPTDTGAELGIIAEDRVIRGENVKVNLFSQEAQKYVALNALEISK